MPDYPTFENELSDEIDRVIAEGGTGYRWTRADEIVERHLEVTSRFKRAGKGSRAANVLKESAHLRADVYVVVLKDDYSTDSFLDIAIPDLARNPELCDVVAVMGREAGGWRIHVLLAARKTKTLDLVATRANVPPERIILLGTISPEPFQRLPIREVDLPDLRETFRQFADEEGITYDATTAADLLACVMASQFVLFAGPSGTGKSTAARMLGSFFASPRRMAKLDVRRHWGGPEDVVGHYSSISGRYVHRDFTQQLLTLAISAEDVDPDDDDRYPSSPVLIVDEANLSPLEGYLSPVFHALGDAAVELITWTLHHKITEADADSPPSQVPIGPYLRVLASINVDSTSPPPAPKVTGRAAVVLMEPTESDAARVLRSLHAKPRDADDQGPAAPVLQSPKVLLDLPDADERIRTSLAALDDLQGRAGLERVPPSDRVQQRSSLFMLAFSALTADLADDITRVRAAAENALAHFVLPTLTPEWFTAAVRRLSEEGLLPPSQEVDDLGGLLRSRVDALASRLDTGLGLDIDFWTALA